MAEAASTMEISEFINGPVINWLETCLLRPEVLTCYKSLLDGLILHSVWLQIDPHPENNPNPDINSLSGEALKIARAKNFECIIRNMKALYEEKLGQTVLIFPDSYTLGYDPETKNGLEQMKLLLQLLLGAAVQCSNKQIFVDKLQKLDELTQRALVELITEVTDNQTLVLTGESTEVLEPTAMYQHIIRLTKERNTMYTKWIESVSAEPELNMSACGVDSTSVMTISPARGTPTYSPSSNSYLETNNKSLEVANLKSKIRKLQQELEEKLENQLELREELAHKNTQYEKLRVESQEWYTEAKRVSAFRDEVDALRERVRHAGRLEADLQKLRDKLADAEFYKTRVEELSEDNRVLIETKEMLEDQLELARKRSELAMTLESEIIEYKQKFNDMELEFDANRTKIEELLEENTQLQLITKTLYATREMDKSFSDNDDGCNTGDNSLSEQLTNNAQTRVLKLELENRRLAAALDQLKSSIFNESTNKILDLQKEKKKQSLKIEKMDENIQKLSQQNFELENIFKNALEENTKLQDALDNRRKSYDKQSQERELERSKIVDLEKQVETVNKEKQRLQILNESIQRRADDLDRLVDQRTKEIEQYAEKSKEFDQLKEKLYDLEAKLFTSERENGSLVKEAAKLKESIEEKSVQLDETAVKLELQTKEVSRVCKQLEQADKTHVKNVELEKQNQDLISQRDINLETIATLRKDLVTGTLASNKVRDNLEKLGLAVDQSDDHASAELSVKTVVEKLVRNPETFKTVREIMLTVSKERHYSNSSGNAKSDMCVLCHRKDIYTVEKNIELSSNSISSSNCRGDAAQELSFEHKVVLSPARENAEFSRISEANTQLNALNTALQSSNEQLQAEKARLSVDVATLGSQITSLNTQHVALQLANSQLAADKDQLLKQAEFAKQEFKNLQQDQVTLQSLHDQLSSQYEMLNRGKEILKLNVRDLRNEAFDLKLRVKSLEDQLYELTNRNAAMESSTEDLAILRTEHSKLTDDFRNLFATSDRFKNEYKNIQEQYKMIRVENGKLKLQSTELTGELNSKSDQIRTLEMEYSRMSQRCDMLLQTNSDLDMDRKTLMDNVSQLLTQYHELLSFSLEDKRHFHEEEKSYAERVHNLSRQKEKLEEKIMEHYKKSESTAPKRKQFASCLVRRVKKASSDFMNKVPSRNRRSWVDESRPVQAQSMIGSESGGNDSDSVEEPTLPTSDAHLLQRNVPMRQSLQRDLMDNTLSRGGVVRSSLQSHKHPELSNSRRNSVHGLEAPDVTGSSLTLGTAGSRRTVYLIDENQKIPDTSNNNSSTLSAASPLDSSDCSTATLGAGATSTAGAEPQTPTNMPINSASTSTPLQKQSDNPAATFLMYNRINTMIGGNASGTLDANMPSGSGSPVDSSTAAAPSQDDKLLRKRGEDKSNSIWYEYGCV